jgi:glycerol-3-phosphate dehydrogenase
MNKSEKVSLIKGDFSPIEAKEILTSVFSTKMQFHKLKNFSSQELFGKEDAVAQERIPELTKSVTTVEEILEFAKQHNKKIHIVSDVYLTVEDNS